jgi:hypothetical protein
MVEVSDMLYELVVACDEDFCESQRQAEDAYRTSHSRAALGCHVFS